MGSNYSPIPGTAPGLPNGEMKMVHNFPQFPAGANIQEAIDWLNLFMTRYEKMLKSDLTDDQEQAQRDRFDEEIMWFTDLNDLPNTDPATLISLLEKQLPK